MEMETRTQGSEATGTMAALTLRDAQATFGIEVEEHLELDRLVPVLTGLQFQGDVAIIPGDIVPAATPIPAGGVEVVRADVGGHPHTLIGSGFFDANGAITQGLVRLGTLTVPQGQVAYLAHEEHGYTGIGPGTYELRRQREMRDAEVPIAD